MTIVPEITPRNFSAWPSVTARCGMRRSRVVRPAQTVRGMMSRYGFSPRSISAAGTMLLLISNRSVRGIPSRELAGGAQVCIRGKWKDDVALRRAKACPCRGRIADECAQKKWRNDREGERSQGECRMS